MAYLPRVSDRLSMQSGAYDRPNFGPTPSDKRSSTRVVRSMGLQSSGYSHSGLQQRAAGVVFLLRFTVCVRHQVGPERGQAVSGSADFVWKSRPTQHVGSRVLSFLAGPCGNEKQRVSGQTSLRMLTSCAHSLRQIRPSLFILGVLKTMLNYGLAP